MEWLRLLISCLSKNGILVFSIHNLLDLASPSSEPFVFVEHSEDQVMSEIGDRIKDASTYGSAYVDIDTLKDWIQGEQGVTKEIIRLGFGGTQDLCVISKR